ncbi:MAG: colanic acid/amylovoran biosynthesis glycosyltransferase [Solirubrobacteraceae bacterium]|nr:colanic acid/amylovoran biosynthesis glycosyltransferase [Solirubrobacteraceae bacterium]
MKVAYVVSRFPHVTETFVVRELDGVDAAADLELELFSLFPAVDGTLHPAARGWVARLRRGSAWGAAGGLAWWACRRPGALLGAVALVARAFARRPSRLARSLVTVALASGHARTMRKLGVEHVHAHFANYPALAAWTVARLAGPTYSFTAHAHDLFRDQSFLRRLVADARFVVAISDFNRAFLAPYNPSDTPVHVVHCGVDPAAWPARPRAAPAHGPVRALCVASLEEKKGHRVLLGALAEADGRLRRVELDLVGPGALRAELQALALALGLGDRVRFHGALAEPAVAELLDRADLFVLASVVERSGFMEGIPVALMEALATGVPVVATRLSGVPELVRDGDTGLLAEPGEAASLRAALERAIGDPDGARRRATAGRALVEREFDARAGAARIAELIRAVAPPPARRG